MRPLLVFSVLLATHSCFSSNVSLLYFKEGGELHLNPSFTEASWAITWKLNRNLVSEWVKDKLDVFYYQKFEGRTTLNIRTGELEIRNATKDDAGNFTLELNDIVLQDVYRAQMIEEVPKPTVRVATLSCGSESKKCTLSCDGNTENAGPVSYLWRLGDVQLEAEDKYIIIYNNQTIQKVEKFFCQLKNPVSQKGSDPLQNPFFLSPPYWVVVLVVLVVLVVVVTVFAFRKRFCQRTDLQNGVEGTANEGKPLRKEDSTPDCQEPVNTEI